MPRNLTKEEFGKLHKQKENLREIRKKLLLQNYDYVPVDFMTPEDVRIETIYSYVCWLEEDSEKKFEQDFAKFIKKNPDYIDTPLVQNENKYKSLLQYALDSERHDLLISIIRKEGNSEIKHPDMLKYMSTHPRSSLGNKRLQELNEAAEKIEYLLSNRTEDNAHQTKESIQELIKNGFNRDLCNLAELAAKKGFPDLIEPLRTSKQIYWNDSALHIAAQSGSKDLLQNLLNSGYDVNSVNKEGKTAADLATEDSENGKFLISKGAESFKKRQDSCENYASMNFEGISCIKGDLIQAGRNTFSIPQIENLRRREIFNKANDTDKLAEDLATTGTFFDDSKISEFSAATTVVDNLRNRESEKAKNPENTKNLYKKSDETVIDLKTQALAETANIYRDEVVSNKLARAFKAIEGASSDKMNDAHAKRLWEKSLTKADRQILHDFYQSQNPSVDFISSSDVFDSNKLKKDSSDLWKDNAELITKMMKWCAEEANLRKDITAEIIKKSEERNKDLYGRNGEEGKLDQAVKAFKNPGKSPSDPKGEPIFSALQTRLLKS